MAKENNIEGMIGGVASFFLPGFGQALQSRWNTAVKFLLAWLVSIVLMFVLIGFILAPIVWIWSIVDAIQYDPNKVV